jgi:hypothetical protein
VAVAVAVLAEMLCTVALEVMAIIIVVATVAEATEDLVAQVILVMAPLDPVVAVAVELLSSGDFTITLTQIQ